MNYLSQQGYISKLLTLRADAQYSKSHRQDYKIIKRLYKHKQNSFHINSAFLFSKKFYDSKKYYLLSFTCLTEVLIQIP